MVDFACKEFEIEAVIKCGLNLTKAELSILKHLLKHSENWFTTEQIAADLSLDASNCAKEHKKAHREKSASKIPEQSGRRRLFLRLPDQEQEGDKRTYYAYNPQLGGTC